MGRRGLLGVLPAASVVVAPVRDSAPSTACAWTKNGEWPAFGCAIPAAAEARCSCAEIHCCSVTAEAPLLSSCCMCWSRCTLSAAAVLSDFSTLGGPCSKEDDAAKDAELAAHSGLSS